MRGVRIFTLVTAALMPECELDPSFALSWTAPEGRDTIVVPIDEDGDPIGSEVSRLPAGEERLEFDLTIDVPFKLAFATYPTDQELLLDLNDCGVRVGGEGGALPPPEGVWLSNLIERDDPGPTSLSKAEEPVELGLRYRTCEAPARSACDDYEVETVFLEGLPGRSFVRAELVDDETLVAAILHEYDVAKREIAAVDRRGTVLFDQEVAEIPRDVAFDFDRTMFVSFADGSVAALDVESWTLSNPRWQGVGTGVASRPDGLVVAHGERSDTRELNVTSTVAVTRDDFPAGLSSLVMARADLMVGLVDADRVLLNEGAGWSNTGFDFELDPSTPARFGFAGRHVFMTNGVSIYRFDMDNPADRWSRLETPFSTIELRGIAALGGDPMVAGTRGTLELITDEGFCTLVPDGLSPSLRSVSISPSGRVAAVSGNALLPDEGGFVVWVTQRR